MNKKTDLSLHKIISELNSFNFPNVDLVLGISSGGNHPARLVAEVLNLPLKFIYITFRSTANKPLYKTPKFIKLDKIPAVAKKILLVDDVSVSGNTLQCAIEHLKNYTVYTFVLKGRADFVLFPEINTCVNWPWNQPAAHNNL
jgi:hypoxanthine phosphoribosyltransferase